MPVVAFGDESFDIDTLGKYFQALSNEANLRGLDFGWLVFRVSDKTRTLVGTKLKKTLNVIGLFVDLALLWPDYDQL